MGDADRHDGAFIDLTYLDTTMLRELYVQLRALDNNLAVLPTADASHIPSGQTLTNRNLNKKAEIPVTSADLLETIKEYSKGNSVEVLQIIDEEKQIEEKLASTKTLVGLLDHIWLTDCDVFSGFSLVPLLKALHLGKEEVDEVNESLESGTSGSIFDLAEATFLDTDSLMTIVTVLYTKTMNSPLFTDLCGNWEVLNYDTSMADIQDEHIDMCHVSRLFDETVEQCIQHRQQITAKNKTTEVSDFITTVKKEMKEFEENITMFASDFPRNIQAVKAEIKKAPSLSIDDTVDMALLPSKCAKRVDKLEEKERMEKTEDDELEVVDVSEGKHPIPTSSWPSDHTLPVMYPGELCFARTNPSQPDCPFEQVQFVTNGESDRKVVKWLNEATSQVEHGDMAYGQTCMFLVDIGTRVLAYCEKRTDNDLPSNWYAATVGVQASTANHGHYLVFADNGRAHYVKPDELRLLCQQAVTWDKRLCPRKGYLCASALMRDFLSRYLNRYPDWPLMRVRRKKTFAPSERLGVEKDGCNYSALVVDVDRQLALLRFPDTQSSQECTDWPCQRHSHVDEWIYRGSLRFRSLNDDIGSRRRVARRPMHRRQFELAGAVERHYASRLADFDVDDDKDEQQRALLTEEPRKTQTARKSTQTQRGESMEEGVGTGTGLDRGLLVARHKQNKLTVHMQFVPPRPDPVPIQGHPVCTPSCIPPTLHDEDPFDEKFKGHSPFLVPLLVGWLRQVASVCRRKGRRKALNTVMYVGPCGRRMRSLAEIAVYLRAVNSKLTIDLFTFDCEIRTTVYARAEGLLLNEDYSQGFENIKISVVNGVDDERVTAIEYEPRRFAAPGVDLAINNGHFCSGCACTDDCANVDTCECRRLSKEHINRLHPSLRSENKGYKYRRLDPATNVFAGFFECNDMCHCSKKRCFNRVVQQPLRVPIQLFKTAEKGWGIRSLVDLPAGYFVCIYSGMIMTNKIADEMGRKDGDEYFADIDLIETVMSEKERQGIDLLEDGGLGREDSLDDATDEQLPASGDESDDWTRKDSDYDSDMSDDDSAGDEQQVTSDRVSEELAESRQQLKRSKVSSSTALVTSAPLPATIKKPMASENLEQFIIFDYFGDEDVFVIDAKSKGNIGRYMNHSCDPNLMVQHVLVDTHDLRLPWVAFFTKKRVKAGEELCWDYNYEVGMAPNRRIDCKCLSDNCRGRLL